MVAIQDRERDVVVGQIVLKAFQALHRNKQLHYTGNNVTAFF